MLTLDDSSVITLKLPFYYSTHKPLYKFIAFFIISLLFSIAAGVVFSSGKSVLPPNFDNGVIFIISGLTSLLMSFVYPVFVLPYMSLSQRINIPLYLSIAHFIIYSFSIFFNNTILLLLLVTLVFLVRNMFLQAAYSTAMETDTSASISGISSGDSFSGLFSSLLYIFIIKSESNHHFSKASLLNTIALTNFMGSLSVYLVLKFFVIVSENKKTGLVINSYDRPSSKIDLEKYTELENNDEISINDDKELQPDSNNDLNALFLDSDTSKVKISKSENSNPEAPTSANIELDDTTIPHLPLEPRNLFTRITYILFNAEYAILVNSLLLYILKYSVISEFFIITKTDDAFYLNMEVKNSLCYIHEIIGSLLGKTFGRFFFPFEDKEYVLEFLFVIVYSFFFYIVVKGVTISLLLLFFLAFITGFLTGVYYNNTIEKARRKFEGIQRDRFMQWFVLMTDLGTLIGSGFSILMKKMLLQVNK